MHLRSSAIRAASLLLTASLGHAQLNPADTPVSIGPLGGSAVDVISHFANPDEVLVVKFTQGLFRSTDGGLNFFPYGTGYTGFLRDLRRDPTSADRLWCIDGKQVLRSDDFGANWTSMGLTADMTLKSISIASHGGSILTMDAFNVYLSTDVGVTWNKVHGVVPFAGKFLEELEFAPSDASVAYVATNKDILRSSDSGQSFASAGSWSGWAQTLTVRPLDANELYIGSSAQGVMRSTNGGASYTVVGDGLTPGDNPEWFAWELDGTTLWYGLLDGVARSTDLGSTWTLEMAGLASSVPITSTLDAASNGELYLGTEGGGLGSLAGGGLYHRNPGDTSWEHLAFADGTTNAVAVAGPSGLRVVGIGSGVYSGPSAQEVLPSVWQADFGTDTRTVAVDPADSTRWVSGGVGAFIDNAQIVVLTGNGTTAVKTFEAFGAGRVEVVQFDPDNPNVVIAGLFPGAFSNEAIIRSTDGGDTWTDIVGTQGWATVDLAFDPFLPGHVLQLSENNQWSRSLDGGVTWALLQPIWPSTGPATFIEFDPFVPGRLYRGDAGDGLWMSDDSVNWTNLGVGLHSLSEILLHPDVPGLMWVGADTGEILVSTDGGQNFEQAWSVPNGGLPAELALDPADGTMLVGTVGQAAWELPGASPFVSLGGGTPGSGGFAARHFQSGGLPRVGNVGFGLSGDQLVGGAGVALFLGLVDIQAPAVGGIYHVGAQVAFFPATASGAGPGAGNFTVNVPLPADPFLVGLPLITQFGAIDAGAADPSGIVLSNAMRTTLLP